MRVSFRLFLNVPSTYIRTLRFKGCKPDRVCTQVKEQRPPATGKLATDAVLKVPDLPSKRSDGEDRESVSLVTANSHRRYRVPSFIWPTFAVTILKSVIVSKVFISSFVLLYDCAIISSGIQI